MNSHSVSRRHLLQWSALTGAALLLPAQIATAQSETVDSALNRLFGRATDPGVGLLSGVQMIGMFADLDRQTDALGLVRPEPGADEEAFTAWLFPLYMMALPQEIGMFALSDTFWRDSFGFDLTEIGQTLDLGDPPARITYYQGQFDRETVQAAWEGAGYRLIDGGDPLIATIGETGELDLQNPIQQKLLASHNNLALVGDDLIIATNTLALLDQALAAATGDAPTLLDNPAFGALIAGGIEMVTGAVVNGSTLVTSPMDLISVTDDIDTAATAIADQMGQSLFPPIALGMIGITPGGPLAVPANAFDATPIPTPETAQMAISLLMLDEAAAESAIEIADTRLATLDSRRVQQPYSTLFAEWEGAVAADMPVANLLLSLELVNPGIWSDLLFSRDMAFIG